MRTVTINNIEVAVLNGGASFGDASFPNAAAIYLKNCRNTTIDNVRILGGRDAGFRGHGIHIESDEASETRATEYFLSKITAYFVQNAIYINGDAEGVYLNHAAFVACKNGLVWADGRCLLVVSDSHMSCLEHCIATNNLWQANIHDNLFYILADSSWDTVAVLLGLDRNVTQPQDSHISRNTIIGSGSRKNGIFITGHAKDVDPENESANYVIVDGNIFRGLDTAVLLGGDTDSVQIYSNLYRQCGNSVYHF